MLEASAAAISPTPASGADDAQNLFTRIVREWPDATARAAIVALACGLFWLTWAHWGDIQIDCGREVYVPYQILRGKLLYRDLWYPYGPLEPYVSALLLKVFGESLSVLYFFGLTLTVGCALVLYELGSMLEKARCWFDRGLGISISGVRAADPGAPRRCVDVQLCVPLFLRGYARLAARPAVRLF